MSFIISDSSNIAAYGFIQRLAFLGEMPQNTQVESNYLYTCIQHNNQTLDITYKFVFDLQNVATADGRKRSYDIRYSQVDNKEIRRLGRRFILGDRNEATYELVKGSARKADERELAILFQSDRKIAFDEAPLLLDEKLAAFGSYLKVALKVFCWPTVPPGFFCFQEQSILGPTQHLDMYLTKRVDVTPQELCQAMSIFLQLDKDFDAENTRAFAIAGRRYYSALSEEDVIDEFSDLWEACEYLSRTNHPSLGPFAAGDKARKVAHRLSQIAGGSEHLWTSKLLQRIYSIRKNLVHEAVSSERKIREACSQLEIIVEVLLYGFAMLPINDKRINELKAEHGI